jgi:hypothetical protein
MSFYGALYGDESSHHCHPKISAALIALSPYE